MVICFGKPLRKPWKPPGVKILMASEPGDYVIYGQQTGHETIIRAENLG